MPNALSRLRVWLWPAPKPRPVSGSVREQLNRIEYKLDRQGWHLTRLALTSSTSGPIAQTSATSTVPTDPPESSASRSPAIIKHGRRYLPKIAGWLGEKALTYLWPLLSGVFLSAWAVMRKYWEAIWSSLESALNWLSALLG